MKYFQRVRSGVPTRPFLAELAAVSQIWDASPRHRGRSRNANAIPLRAPRPSAIVDRARGDVHESRWTGNAARFRLAGNFLRNFAAERHVDLGRARIVRIPSGHRMQPHVDRGEYYLFRDRYHLVLKSSGGSWLRAGDEDVTMREGELWWFNNKAPHESWNPGVDEHVHLVFDVLNAGGKRMLDHAVRVRAARDSAIDAPMA